MSSYAGPYLDVYVSKFHVDAHNILMTDSQHEAWPSAIPELEVAQSKLISCIGAYYTGDSRQKRFRESMLGELLDFCRTTSTKYEGNNTALTWESWIERESSIRTAHVIWVGDGIPRFRGFR